MKYEMPLEYVAYLAFSFMVETEDKRQLEINQLLEYRNLLIEKTNELYLEDPSWYNPDKEFVLFNNRIDFKKINLKDINEFVEDNQDLFTFNKKTITLKEEITSNELEEIVNTYDLGNDSIKALLLDAYYCKESLEILRLNKFKNDVESFIHHEKEIETLYKSLNNVTNNMTTVNDIKMRQYISNIKYNKILHYDRDYYAIYYCELLMYFEDPKSIFLPTILKNTNIETEINEFQKTSLKRDTIMNAIFTDVSLACHKITCKLDRLDEVIHEEDLEIDEHEDTLYNPSVEYESPDDFIEEINIFSQEVKEYTNDYRNQLLSFAMNYIYNIDEFECTNPKDENLLQAKNRLLYLYDDYQINLYNKNNFNRVFEYYQNLKSYHYLDHYNLIAKACIVDIFENPKVEKLNNKILFIKTCYHLLKEQEIIDTFNSYNNHEKYQDYKKIVIGEEKTKKKIK